MRLDIYGSLQFVREFRGKNTSEARIAGDVQVVVNILPERGMDIAGLSADEVTAIADIVPGPVVAFHAQGAFPPTSVVLDDVAVAVRAAQNILHEYLALAALRWIVAGRPRYILGQTWGGPVIYDDFAHLFRH
jgi:hypothetical protein